MGLIRYNQPAITVDISDKVIGGTTIKRRVRFDNMDYNQGGQTEGQIFGQTSPGHVNLNCTVLLFSVGEGGSYGEPLNGQFGFNNYQRSLRADNSTLVNAETGVLIGDRSLEQDPASFQPANEAENKPAGILFMVDYMYEFEFFRRMAENMPVVVDDLIENYILGGDARGVF